MFASSRPTLPSARPDMLENLTNEKNGVEISQSRLQMRSHELCQPRDNFKNLVTNTNLCTMKYLIGLGPQTDPSPDVNENDDFPLNDMLVPSDRYYYYDYKPEPPFNFMIGKIHIHRVMASFLRSNSSIPRKKVVSQIKIIIINDIDININEIIFMNRIQNDNLWKIFDISTQKREEMTLFINLNQNYITNIGSMSMSMNRIEPINSNGDGHMNTTYIPTRIPQLTSTSQFASSPSSPSPSQVVEEEEEGEEKDQHIMSDNSDSYTYSSYSSSSPSCIDSSSSPSLTSDETEEEEKGKEGGENERESREREGKEEKSMGKEESEENKPDMRTTDDDDLGSLGGDCVYSSIDYEPSTSLGLLRQPEYCEEEGKEVERVEREEEGEGEGFILLLRQPEYCEEEGEDFQV